MSTDKKRRPGAGTYLLPLVIAVPAAAVLAFAVSRVWPAVHKAVDILLKLVVKA